MIMRLQILNPLRGTGFNLGCLKYPFLAVLHRPAFPRWGSVMNCWQSRWSQNAPKEFGKKSELAAYTTLIGLLTLSPVSITRAQVGGEIQSLLSQPVRLINRAGRSFQGHIERVAPTQVAITAQIGDGEVIYRFGQAEISRISFPGEALKLLADELMEEGNLEEALPLLEALFEQRSPFFRFIPPGEIAFFLRLADAYQFSGHPVKAIAIGNLLSQFLTSEKAKLKIDDTLLLANFSLRLITVTRRLAIEWTGKYPRYHDSALGWWILSQIAFEEEDYGAAMWSSLHPVVFSSHLPMDYLENCYAYAIASANELNKEEKALNLYLEMKERNLDWPDIPELSIYRGRLAKIAGE